MSDHHSNNENPSPKELGEKQLALVNQEIAIAKKELELTRNAPSNSLWENIRSTANSGAGLAAVGGIISLLLAIAGHFIQQANDVTQKRQQFESDLITQAIDEVSRQAKRELA